MTVLFSRLGLISAAFVAIVLGNPAESLAETWP